MHRTHNYQVRTVWTGNKGQGTSGYQAYERSHEIQVEGKPKILASSDPKFRGDANRYNPEELFLASIATCHMLWYLHLCADNQITVLAYTDNARGTMEENLDGSGQFVEVILAPVVTIGRGDSVLAESLHDQANSLCFIARSLNFPVQCRCTVIVDSPDAFDS